jgi:predicted MarR family transcription regulator
LPKSAASSLGPIVSSRHLADGASPALSEFEFALIMAMHAFQRWVVRCADAAGAPDLSALDVLVLHNVNHRDKPKRLADICLVLNIEDTHLVSYALKKLGKLGFVETRRRGKEKLVSATAKGRAACAAYRGIREELLTRSLASMGQDERGLADLARAMRALSGHYDQAARGAASL